jgi:hypothetical protein
MQQVKKDAKQEADDLKAKQEADVAASHKSFGDQAPGSYELARHHEAKKHRGHNHEHFVCAALSGLLPIHGTARLDKIDTAALAAACIKIADAVCAELEKPEPGPTGPTAIAG